MVRESIRRCHFPCVWDSHFPGMKRIDFPEKVGMAACTVARYWQLVVDTCKKYRQ